MTAAETIAWPVKTRDLQNHHMNSTVWDSFKFRDGDIVVATYAKSGTTWMQQILAQLIFNGAENLEISKVSPWVDFRLMPPEVIAGLEDLAHRRFVKTHLPVDALVFSSKAKYLYIGRDGRAQGPVRADQTQVEPHVHGAAHTAPQQREALVLGGLQQRVGRLQHHALHHQERLPRAGEHLRRTSHASPASRWRGRCRRGAFPP